MHSDPEEAFFAIKNNDSETFMKCFEFVIDYYESKGYKVKILRSDYFFTFVAADLKKFKTLDKCF